MGEFLFGLGVMGIVWGLWAYRAAWNPWAMTEIEYLKSKLRQKTGI